MRKGQAYGSKITDLPDDWQCPTCGVSEDDFEKEE
jgi:rubredoxin